MAMKKEAKQIQEMNQDADTQCVKSLCTSDKKRLESSQSVKWHLCVSCEAEQTGRTQDQVMDSTFKKQKEHKLNRVKRYKEMLIEREKRKLLVLSNLEAKGKAPAVVAKDVKAHNDLVPKLKESSVKDDKVTKASTPEVHSFTDEDIPASSYQEEPVSSKDSTCSCNSSLQILAACFTCCVVRV